MAPRRTDLAMTMFQSLGMLLTICAVCAYLNQRFLRWPQVLAMNMMSLVLATGLIILGHIGFAPIDEAEKFVQSFDFADLVLHGILGLLLFAGALFIDVEDLRRWAKPIAALATLGVLVSAVVVGAILWVAARAIGLDLPFLWCLLFGALISPTDPIAALAIVRSSGAPKAMEIKLVGESLFNDATGVMLFLVILGIIKTGDISPSLLAHELFVAPVGGAVLGLGLGWLSTRAISMVNHHPTEILITLALAVVSYGLAEWIHVSAPISVVAAGLVIGHRARKHAMTEETRQHLDVFWEGIDEVINASLFVLIGLELVLINLHWQVLVLGVVGWGAVLAGRWLGVIGVLAPMRRKGGLGAGTTRVMVWGGLRGGISLALALSLPPSPEASILVAATFIVVALSGAVQGLTLRRVIPKQVAADAEDKNAIVPPEEGPAAKL